MKFAQKGMVALIFSAIFLAVHAYPPRLPLNKASWVSEVMPLHYFITGPIFFLAMTLPVERQTFFVLARVQVLGA